MFFEEELRHRNILYVSGYENDTSAIKVRCLVCGNEWEIKYHSLIQGLRGHREKRKNYLPCPVCRARRDYIQIYQIKNKKEAERKQKEYDAFFESFGRWLENNTVGNYRRKCNNCGQTFITTNKSTKYCCSNCRIRAKRRRKTIARDERILSRRRDQGITLDKLYRKEKGVCYLCGKLCDQTDFKKIDGVMIAGNSYPSIEHIVPISKGGTDTWDNVKLAHRVCNSRKGKKFEEQTKLF